MLKMMTRHIKRCFCALLVGVFAAISQRSYQKKDAVEVARDVWIECENTTSAMPVSEDERVTKLLAENSLQVDSLYFYTSDGRIGCCYAAKGNESTIRAIDAAVLNQLVLIAKTTPGAHACKKELKVDPRLFRIR